MRRILAFLLLVAAHCQAGDSSPPITFHYVKTGQFNNQGYITSGTVFWATNHTTNALAITLATIENKAGSNWIVQTDLREPMRFPLPGKPWYVSDLRPNSSGYATVQLSVQPTGTIWRVRASVQPALTGVAATAAAVRGYPDMLGRRFQYGNTNIPLNLFATNITFYGPSTSVFSQEASQE